jgi:hypothetical protein
VSKSSFLLLLLTVASLTAAASFNAGGLRGGKPELRYEANATLVSLQDDYYSLRAEAERTPHEMALFIRDLAQDCRFLAADFRVEARIAARYVTDLFRSGTDRVEEASAAHHT